MLVHSWFGCDIGHLRGRRQFVVNLQDSERFVFRLGYIGWFWLFFRQGHIRWIFQGYIVGCIVLGIRLHSSQWRWLTLEPHRRLFFLCIRWLFWSWGPCWLWIDLCIRWLFFQKEHIKFDSILWSHLFPYLQLYWRPWAVGFEHWKIPLRSPVKLQ